MCRKRVTLPIIVSFCVSVTFLERLATHVDHVLWEDGSSFLIRRLFSRHMLEPTSRADSILRHPEVCGLLLITSAVVTGAGVITLRHGMLGEAYLTVLGLCLLALRSEAIADCSPIKTGLDRCASLRMVHRDAFSYGRQCPVAVGRAHDARTCHSLSLSQSFFVLGIDQVRIEGAGRLLDSAKLPKLVACVLFAERCPVQKGVACGRVATP